MTKNNNKSLKKQRKDLKKLIKKRMLRYGSPRLQMFFILTIVVLTGFAATVLMAKLGIKEMYIRYPVSVAAAYGSFFLSLSVWVKLIISKKEYNIEFEGDILEIIDETGIPLPDSSLSASSDSTSGFSLSDLDLDLDEGFVFVIIAILILSVVIIAGYFIFTAPVFLSEILLDAALGAGFYKKLKRIQSDGWITSAFKKTWLYFLIVLILYTAGGYMIQSKIPNAVTFGDAIKHVLKE